MNSLTIGKLAREANVGVETVRYYQRRGLLATPERPGGADAGGAVRRYGAQDVQRLRFIRSAQAAGFQLSEIAELLVLDATDDRARARALARERIAALEQQIASLRQAQASLVRLAEECESDAEGACPILLAFDGHAGHEPATHGCDGRSTRR